jgi:hypothetical protein
MSLGSSDPDVTASLCWILPVFHFSVSVRDETSVSSVVRVSRPVGYGVRLTSQNCGLHRPVVHVIVMWTRV